MMSDGIDVGYFNYIIETKSFRDLWAKGLRSDLTSLNQDPVIV